MSIKLKGSSDGSVSFDAPADTSPSGSDITLTLPTSAGSANQFLKNSGIAGELEYSSMVETSTGIGIGGVASPFDKLQVRTVADANFVFSSAGGTEASFEIFNNAGSSNTPLNYRASEHKFKIQANEKMRLDSSGQLLVGGTSNFVRGQIQVIDSGGGEITIARDDTSVASGNDIGHLFYASKDGGTGVVAANISCYADGSHSSTSAPASLRFLVCPSGSTSPNERLRIGQNGEQRHYGTNATNLNIANTASAGNQYEFLYCQHSSTGLASGTNSFRVATDGDVFNTNNSYGSLSDRRLKENIVDATSQWNDIKGLQVRKYNFREATGHETHTQLGLIAQEVESVSPGLVETSAVKEGETVQDADGNQLESIKSINYSVLYMKAVKALQEAQTRIETLETQHADLLARVAALEAA